MAKDEEKASKKRWWHVRRKIRLGLLALPTLALAALTAFETYFPAAVSKYVNDRKFHYDAKEEFLNLSITKIDKEVKIPVLLKPLNFLFRGRKEATRKEAGMVAFERFLHKEFITDKHIELVVLNQPEKFNSMNPIVYKMCILWYDVETGRQTPLVEFRVNGREQVVWKKVNMRNKMFQKAAVVVEGAAGGVAVPDKPLFQLKAKEEKRKNKVKEKVQKEKRQKFAWKSGKFIQRKGGR